MHQLLKALALLAMGFMLVACSDSSGFDDTIRLDTSSEESLAASIDAMAADTAGRQKVAGALAAIMMMRGFEMMGENLSEEETHARMMEGLHGLTASELVAKAEEIAAEMEARQ